jgi:hypothetical protein
LHKGKKFGGIHMKHAHWLVYITIFLIASCGSSSDSQNKTTGNVKPKKPVEDQDAAKVDPAINDKLDKILAKVDADAVGDPVPGLPVDYQFAWQEVSPEIANLYPSLQPVVFNNYLYSIVNNNIYEFTGQAWQQVTNPVAPVVLAGKYHVVAKNRIYAVIDGGQVGAPNHNISRWDGTNWVVVAPNPQAAAPYYEIGYIKPMSDQFIYARVGEKIMVYQRNAQGLLAWSDVTPAQPGLSDAIHIEDPYRIYAVAGTQISYFNGGQVWQTIQNTENPQLRGYMEFHGVDEIYGVIDTKVCLFDGTGWQKVSDPIDGLKGPFYTSGETVYAVVGYKIYKWAKTDQPVAADGPDDAAGAGAGAGAGAAGN